ncbi:MAG: hypothetical protein ABSG15_00765 [FCB group bacterium]|jgi:hypothetical protein
MKTKEQGWIKGSFEIKLTYDDEPKQIENGRIYRYFGVDMSNRRKELYHIPTRTRLGIYELTLKEIKELVDRLLEVDIDWASSEMAYYQSIDKEINKRINKIITVVK